MAFSFKIIKPKQTLERQWDYLLKRVDDKGVAQLKKFLVGLSFASGLYLLFYFLTRANDYIVFKGVVMVLLALAWCAVPISYLLVRFSRMKRRRWLRWFLNNTGESQLRYSVQIDDEKVSVAFTDFAYEMPWSNYKVYGLWEETIYVFHDEEPMKSLYWDRTEMGREAYQSLLELLQQKALKQAF
ncbi:MAG: hypothetical protein EOO10_11085 [Chitinophagaceae bacterium]|nr:MAG: hypothetical protein EOO10_11085 [Chitinophagaceae bacterium]